VEVSAIGGRAGALYLPLEFARVAAGLEADLMVGLGTGVATPRRGTAWSLAAGMELAVIPMKVDGLQLEIALQGRWTWLPASFEIVRYGNATTTTVEPYRVPDLGAAGVVRATYYLF
jgi:hypothetical protein